MKGAEGKEEKRGKRGLAAKKKNKSAVVSGGISNDGKGGSAGYLLLALIP